jgi:hypothetical protein
MDFTVSGSGVLEINVPYTMQAMVSSQASHPLMAADTLSLQIKQSLNGPALGGAGLNIALVQPGSIPVSDSATLTTFVPISGPGTFLAIASLSNQVQAVSSIPEIPTPLMLSLGLLLTVGVERTRRFSSKA